MAGPSIGTWVKVKNKSGRMTSRVIANKFGGGGYSQGEVITQSEYNGYKEKRAEGLAQKQSAPKQEVVGFQGDLFGGGQTIITNQIRKEEQRGKNGRGMTPTVKAAIAKTIVARVPDVASKIKNEKPTDRLTDQAIKALQSVAGSSDTFRTAAGQQVPVIKNHEMFKKFPGVDVTSLKKAGVLQDIGGSRYGLTDKGIEFLRTYKDPGTIEINVPGATTYRVRNNGYALGTFLKKVGIKPEELSKLSKQV